MTAQTPPALRPVPKGSTGGGTVATTIDSASWGLSLVQDWKMTTAASNALVVWVRPQDTGKRLELKPGSSVSLFREGPFGEGRDLVLKFETPGKARFSILMQSTLNGESVRSSWFDVDVDR